MRERNTPTRRQMIASTVTALGTFSCGYQLFAQTPQQSMKDGSFHSGKQNAHFSSSRGPTLRPIPSASMKYYWIPNYLRRSPGCLLKSIPKQAAPFPCLKP